jgi:hypothetical protein
MEFKEMNRQQRAQFLLDKGVVAQLDIDPVKIEPAYLAAVPGIGSLPCGYFETEGDAVTAGTNWLRAIATSPAN